MQNRKAQGFTLMEMLIVVAIIAILTAIAIPVFSAQLEKSREAADLGNLRAVYAEVMTAVLLEDESSPFYDVAEKKWTATVDLTQQQDGWAMETPLMIGGIQSSADGGSNVNAEGEWIGKPKAGGTCVITVSESGKAVLLFDGSLSGGEGGSSNSSVAGSESTSETGHGGIVPHAVELHSVNYNVKKGNVYKYHGIPYVAAQDGNAQYNLPDVSSWLFILVRDDAVIFDESSINDPDGIRGSGAKIGDFFVYSDGGTYILRYTSDPLAEPRSASGSGAWIRIEK